MLEPRRCEDIKGIVAPGMGLKSLGTFEEQGQVMLKYSEKNNCYFLLGITLSLVGGDIMALLSFMFLSNSHSRL